MADDTPQGTTTIQDSPVDQPVAQTELPKAEEQPADASSEVSTKEETPVPETPPEEKPNPEIPQTPLPDEASAKSGEPSKEEPKTEEPKVETKEAEKPKDVSAETSVKAEEIKPESPKSPQIPQPNLDELRAKANKERQDRKSEHLSEVEKLAKSKQINNNDVRELLHVSQSTATNYLEELTKQGKLKKSGKAKGTTYTS